MELIKIKEILCQQLELLTEKSQACENIHDLVSVSQAICEIVRILTIGID